MRAWSLLIVFISGCAVGGIGATADDDDTDPPDSAVARPDATGTGGGSCGSCPTPSLCCDYGDLSGCVNPGSDPLNCGSCGNVCDSASADRCTTGECRCLFEPACGAASTCCPSAGCRNLASDSSNCGACGASCGPGAECMDGACSCPAGQTVCPGDGCADLASDVANCGSCGTTCTAGMACVDGACTCGGMTCAAGDTCCGDVCIDTADDATNCGACGNVCASGTPECQLGECGCSDGSTCPAPSAVTMPLCCPGGCIDTCDDDANCGGCGFTCGTDSIGCLGGSCYVIGGTWEPLATCGF